jgi:hypothetical protein
MDLPAAIPASLVSRLIDDQASASAALAGPDLSAGTSATRTFAHRKLNSLVPKALRTVDQLLDGDERTALAAASKILDLAPATRPASLGEALAESLSPEALSAIAAGLSAFATAALGASPPATTIIPDSVEVLDV